jgi:hypothetical protein
MLSFGEFFPSLVDHTKKIWQPWCRPMHFCCSPFTKDFEIQSQRREINGNAGSDLNKKTFRARAQLKLRQLEPILQSQGSILQNFFSAENFAENFTSSNFRQISTN